MTLEAIVFVYISFPALDLSCTHLLQVLTSLECRLCLFGPAKVNYSSFGLRRSIKNSSMRIQEFFITVYQFVVFLFNRHDQRHDIDPDFLNN